MNDRTLVQILLVTLINPLIRRPPHRLKVAPETVLDQGIGISLQGAFAVLRWMPCMFLLRPLLRIRQQIIRLIRTPLRVAHKTPSLRRQPLMSQHSLGRRPHPMIHHQTMLNKVLRRLTYRVPVLLRLEAVDAGDDLGALFVGGGEVKGGVADEDVVGDDAGGPDVHCGTVADCGKGGVSV